MLYSEPCVCYRGRVVWKWLFLISFSLVSLTPLCKTATVKINEETKLLEKDSMELNSLLLWWWWCCESQWWSGLHSNNCHIKNHSMISLFGPVFNVKKKMVEVTKCFIISFIVSLTDIFSIYSHSLCCSHLIFSSFDLHCIFHLSVIHLIWFICQFLSGKVPYMRASGTGSCMFCVSMTLFICLSKHVSSDSKAETN